MYCPQCGSDASSGVQYCRSCGANLKVIGMPPSPVCDDATFLRRVTLDIAGRLPTEEETARFHASADSNKRDQVIDDLLRSPDYADFFAGKWTALLKNRRDDSVDIVSNFAFHAWVRDSLLANKPYDQLVRELLAATGTVIGNPPVAWYYVLARCNLDGNSTRDGLYFTSSTDTRIQSRNPGH